MGQNIRTIEVYTNAYAANRAKTCRMVHLNTPFPFNSAGDTQRKFSENFIDVATITSPKQKIVQVRFQTTFINNGPIVVQIICSEIGIGRHGDNGFGIFTFWDALMQIKTQF